VKRYICVFCGFIFDEALGRPAEGIAPGTRWEDVPESWECPDCGNPKSAFVMEEI
jgi:rubredoxin